VIPFLLLALLAAPPALDEGLRDLPAGPPRAVWAAGQLRGAPYAHSSLGEGGGIDPDPRFRLDRFDCVTLVETALALGASTRVADAAVLIDDIRYGGPVAFGSRNHYVEAQWLPSLVAKGWIEDATARVAGDRARREFEEYTLDRWRRSQAAGRLVPGLPVDGLPVGAFPLPFVPLEDVPPIAGQIPDGTIVLVVREARASRPYRVTHMGIVTSVGGKRVVRHASPGKGRVVDEPFDRFLARLRRFEGWPVSGLGFWAIRDNSPRAQGLLKRDGGG
jgi:Protein of unknown function (DUF1460)